jgi:hypothetical protein
VKTGLSYTKNLQRTNADSADPFTTAVARIFLPRAKAPAAERGVPWPQAIEDADRGVLTGTLPERHRTDR